jgi:hypothetical protein
LRALFWIALSNFVFPAFFAIAQYVLIFRDSNPTHFLIVMISNIYVEIIGVLFATIWASTYNNEPAVSPVQTHALQFGRNTQAQTTTLDSMRFPGGDQTRSSTIFDDTYIVMEAREKKADCPKEDPEELTGIVVI